MELFNKMIRSSRNFRGLNACCNSDDFKHFVWSLCHVVVFYDQIHIPEILSLCALEWAAVNLKNKKNVLPSELENIKWNVFKYHKLDKDNSATLLGRELYCCITLPQHFTVPHLTKFKR